MRINEFRGPHRLGGKNLRKTDSAGGGDFTTHLEGTEAEDSPAAPTLSGIGALGSVLLLQEDGGGLDGRQESCRHGNRLLEHLDRLRMDLLLGQVSVGQMERLRQVLEREQPEHVPPEMREVLDEIQLRVRVELAKFGR